jgi:putative methanogenesis marker protein 8
MTEHLLEMAGALVRIRDGEIEVLTDPQIRRCPLRQYLYGCQEESRDTVDQVLRMHMREMGMYGPGRVLEILETPVSFGASEIIMDAMAEGLVDAAVVVCEGAGTAVVTRPEVLQAVGVHMTGLISTDPIKEIQQGLKNRGCILLDQICTMDQVRGFLKAAEAGFRKIAVTITGHRASDARSLRELEEVYESKPIILAVHNTGVGDNEAQVLAECCDIVWACASKSVREVVGKRSKIQIGISIPVFAQTDTGKRMVLNRALHFQKSLVIHIADLPYAPGEKQPLPLI